MAQAATGSSDHATGVPVTTVTTPVRVTDLDFQRHMGNTAFTDLFANARFTVAFAVMWRGSVDARWRSGWGPAIRRRSVPTRWVSRR